MTKQARVDNGIVAETAPADAQFEAGLFVSCGDEVEVGWHYARGVFSPPPPPAVKVIPLSQAKESAQAEVGERAAILQMAACGGDASPMLAAAISEAEKWRAGSHSGDFPFLDARVAAAVAKDRADSAQQIYDRHCEYCKQAAAIEGYRLGIKRRIAAAATQRQLDEILRSADWPIPTPLE